MRRLTLIYNLIESKVPHDCPVLIGFLVIKIVRISFIVEMHAPVTVSNTRSSFLLPLGIRVAPSGAINL